jgi:hypothetical protein
MGTPRRRWQLFEKPDVTLEQAAQVFSIHSSDMSMHLQWRAARRAVGLTSTLVCCSWCTSYSSINASVSFRRAALTRKRGNTLKRETIKARFAKDRPMVSITLRMAVDAVDDLKGIAALKGYSGYRSLMRAHVGACPREDLEICEGSAVANMTQKRRAIGVGEEILSKLSARIAIHR